MHGGSLLLENKKKKNKKKITRKKSYDKIKVTDRGLGVTGIEKNLKEILNKKINKKPTEAKG